MEVIYSPRGRAREYSKWALNVYNGCSHGCVYCYVPKIVNREYNSFRTDVYPRKKVVELLEHDLNKHHAALQGEEDAVLLSFTCDPYQPIEEKLKLTRQCLELFCKYGVPVQILTKGCRIAQRDFDLLQMSPFNKYAVTITHTDSDFLKKLEPNASSYEERVASLRLAREKGITTWVSLEPVIEFEETYKIIEATHMMVDQFRVGKLNYDPYETQLDWKNSAGV